MPSMTGTRRIVISVIVLAVAAVIVVMMLASRPRSSAMAAMDHGSVATPQSAPTTAGSGSSHDMAGMDHGAPATGNEEPATDHHAPGTGHDSGNVPGMGKPVSTPTPPMSEDMPGMDHGTSHKPESGHGAADTAEANPDRPLAPVLGVFGGGTSAVLLTAGLLRRRDRAADRVKQAARAARRSQI